MLTRDFDYTLPEELIAQEPLANRDESRLMVVNKASETIEHRRFCDIVDLLHAGDVVVFNDTRVVPGRLEGTKETGGRVEVLLLSRVEAGVWKAMVKPGRRVGVGVRLHFDGSLSCEVLDRTEEGGRVLKFQAAGDPDELIAQQGRVPLPPYIRKELVDSERYQTVYAAAEGSAAAPTAGLHFTSELIERIQAKGVRTAWITLHVGVATFRPVRTEQIEDHVMHREWYVISEDCAQVVNEASGRVVAVGTTTARALESAALRPGKVAPKAEETGVFIAPGYRFKVVDCLVTNFHIPKSTLLMMVSALAGRELVMKAYREAVDCKYRFFSFGDAMFLC